MIQGGKIEKRISDILIQHGKIKQTILDELVIDQFTSINDTLFGQTLVSLGLISDEDLSLAIAEQKKLGFVDLAKVDIDEEFQKKCPLDIIEAHLIFPLYQKDDESFFAIHLMPDKFVKQLLANIFSGKIVYLIACKELLFERIQIFIGNEIEAIKEKNELYQSKHLEIQKLMDGEENIEDELIDPRTVITFVDDLFYRGIVERASDIHIESTRTGILVRFRIDGVLNPILELKESMKNPIFSRMMILSGMDITTKSLPQDGRINAAFGPGKLRMEARAALIPGIWGPNLNIRILKNIRIEYDLEVLGLTDHYLKIIESHLKRKFGLILIGGPTGSGKSTTIYSCIEGVKSEENQVISIEDPVEVPLDGIIQMGVIENRVDDERNVDFARGLRSILRMDPDVIVIGEIRDSETAKIAISSSLTGHLVISTVHAKNTIECIRRLMDLGVPAPDLFAALNLLISQRLLRRICDLCKIVIELPIENDMLSLRYQDVSKIYAGRGCSRCLGTGYYDRTGVFEVLPITEEIQNLGIADQKDLHKLNKLFKANTFSTLNDDACLKVMHGITSLDEVTRILWEV
ncbi:GspE/PulE family protein [Candidatus Riflebacteria bacterium]